MGTIREVRKRDGRVVPFDESKIADAIYKAIRSVGKGDRSLSEELASAVTHFLEKKFALRIPGIEDIQDQVETVLIETGHAEIAKAYILYRNKRTSVREVLQVRKEREGPIGGPELVEDRDGVAPWSKSKITAALIREADMEIGVAEEIASAVERKVFAAGIRRISTSLIRELVDNELFERGCSAKLSRQAPIGLPKYNLEQILFGADTKEGFTFPKTPVEVRDFIATQILQQYSLDEVVSESVSEAHRDGRIHLHRLGDPIRFDCMGWDLGACGSDGRGGEGIPAGLLGLTEFCRELRYLKHFVAGEIRLHRPDRLLPGRPTQGDLELFYERLQEIQNGPPRAIFGLELDLDRDASPWLQVLSERPLEKGPVVYLRLQEDSFCDPQLRGALRIAANLFERGETIEFLPCRRSWDCSAGGLGLLPVAAKITINLPRLAFRSASDRLGRIERELDEILDILIKGHLNWRRFLEKLGSNRENPLWGILGRPWENLGGQSLARYQDILYPVGILGLNECVKFLTGFELHQESRSSRAGRKIVEMIAAKLKRESARLGLQFLLTESRNTGDLRRLEEIDRMRFREESLEIDRGRTSPGRPEDSPRQEASYSDGVRLQRTAPVDPLRRMEHLGGFLGHLEPVGVIEESPQLRNAGGELILSLLEESLPYLAGKRARMRSGL